MTTESTRKRSTSALSSNGETVGGGRCVPENQ